MHMGARGTVKPGSLPIFSNVKRKFYLVTSLWVILYVGNDSNTPGSFHKDRFREARSYTQVTGVV